MNLAVNDAQLLQSFVPTMKTNHPANSILVMQALGFDQVQTFGQFVTPYTPLLHGSNGEDRQSQGTLQIRK